MGRVGLPGHMRGAAIEGNTDRIHGLIEARASVNQADAGGWAPLHYAARGGHAIAVRALLRAGADAYFSGA